MATRKKPPGFEMPPSNRKGPAAAEAASAPEAESQVAGGGHTPPEEAAHDQGPAASQPVGWVYRSGEHPNPPPAAEGQQPAASARPAATPTHWLERAVMQTLGSSYLLLLMPLSWKPMKRSTKSNPKEST